MRDLSPQRLALLEAAIQRFERDKNWSADVIFGKRESISSSALVSERKASERALDGDPAAIHLEFQFNHGRPAIVPG
jgi:hypothetical protein